MSASCNLTSLSFSQLSFIVAVSYYTAFSFKGLTSVLKKGVFLGQKVRGSTTFGGA